MRIRNRRPVRVVGKEEKMAFKQELEHQYPGYLDEDLKLHSMVSILTGLRLLYGIFYFVMAFLYGMASYQSVMTLLSPLFFYVWYTLMLQSGKGIAVAMLGLRAFSIINGGVSTIQMAAWLPYPLIFTLVTACILEFVESIFCIYVLFNRNVAQTVRLNRGLMAAIAKGAAAPGTLERMAEYQNPEEPEEEENEPSEK